ncbi:ATP-binding cassette domain-containing protein [Culturomica massiliensis]|uniref:ATP-binding cassette domain-containing protein n=1 Tax=Culturomica massiliensis TaxID=1841857 RepID=UPI00266666BD|nr:ABC transporter ATP-binding protein [Culturomica massiliensis]
MSTLISVNNLSLDIHGKKLLKNISFEVERGDVFAILGSNGAGKSLLLDCLIGNIDSSYDKNTLCENAFDKNKCGILYDSFASIPLLKVKEIFSWLSVLFGKEIDFKLIEQLEIRNILAKQFKVLSKGENKKAGIYAALFHNPELVILDEPTDGLDPIVRNKFWDILCETGNTIIFTTHIWNEVENIATKVLFLHQGAVLNIPMSPVNLINNYLPYKGKIVVFKADRDHLPLCKDNYYEDEQMCCLYYKNEVEKEEYLKEIKKKVVNYSVLSPELKDVYRFLINQDKSI